MKTINDYRKESKLFNKLSFIDKLKWLKDRTDINVTYDWQFQFKIEVTTSNIQEQLEELAEEFQFNTGVIKHEYVVDFFKLLIGNRIIESRL